MDIRQTGDTNGADHLSAEIEHRDGDATHLRIEFAIVKCNAVLSYLDDLAPQELRFGYRFRGISLQFGTLEEALELLGPQRSKDDFSQRRAMGRTQNADAVCELNAPGPTCEQRP